MNKIPLTWSLPIGVSAVLAQMLFYFIRFKELNSQATFEEYILFFVSGLLGGLILLFFLNRQTSLTGRRTVWIGFLLAAPLALILMLAGGLLGPLGVLIIPQIPWALFAWIASLIGHWLTRRRAPDAQS